jgi:hypothetical protein
LYELNGYSDYRESYDRIFFVYARHNYVDSHNPEHEGVKGPGNAPKRAKYNKDLAKAGDAL